MHENQGGKGYKKHMLTVSSAVQLAYDTAIAARARAHAPYSRFQVGAAVKLSGVDAAVPGCNVENASYGAAICAERVALTQTVAVHGKKPIEFLVVVTGEANATPPCALCLQVIAEFAGDDTPIYLGNLAGIQRRYLLRELLPVPFRSFQP